MVTVISAKDDIECPGDYGKPVRGAILFTPLPWCSTSEHCAAMPRSLPPAAVQPSLPATTHSTGPIALFAVAGFLLLTTFIIVRFAITIAVILILILIIIVAMRSCGRSLTPAGGGLFTAG